MKQPRIGQVIVKNGKRYAVVELLDCTASYDSNEEKPTCSSVSVSPIKGNKVMGRTRMPIMDNYELTGYFVEVPVYRVSTPDYNI